MTPLSIPSPPAEWRIFELGTWIHSWLPAWPAEWGLPIHMYALCIIAGIVAAVLITNHRLTKRGGEPWIIVDVALWAVVFGIVAARFYHVFTHPDDYFGPGKDLLAILYIWEGGNAIFGALIGGALGVWIASRLAGLRFWSVADAIAPSLLVAQAIGRLGNWFNHELFGLPTDLPWGLEIEPGNPAIPAGLPADTLFHPTFLYEMIWNLAGFVLIVFVIEHRVRLAKAETWPASLAPAWPVFQRRAFWQWGKVLGLYLIWYGAGRIWFESIRLDPSETWLGIRSNVWAAFAAVVIGLIIIIAQTRAHTGLEPSIYRPGREWKPGSGVDSQDTYSESDEVGDDVGALAGAAATSGTAGNS